VTGIIGDARRGWKCGVVSFACKKSKVIICDERSSQERRSCHCLFDTNDNEDSGAITSNTSCLFSNIMTKTRVGSFRLFFAATCPAKQGLPLVEKGMCRSQQRALRSLTAKRLLSMPCQVIPSSTNVYLLTERRREISEIEKVRRSGNLSFPSAASLCVPVGGFLRGLIRHFNNCFRRFFLELLE